MRPEEYHKDVQLDDAVADEICSYVFTALSDVIVTFVEEKSKKIG